MGDMGAHNDTHFTYIVQCNLSWKNSDIKNCPAIMKSFLHHFPYYLYWIVLWYNEVKVCISGTSFKRGCTVYVSHILDVKLWLTMGHYLKWPQLIGHPHYHAYRIMWPIHIYINQSVPCGWIKQCWNKRLQGLVRNMKFSVNAGPFFEPWVGISYSLRWWDGWIILPLR